MKILTLCLAAQLTALAASHLFAGDLTWDGNTALPLLQDGGGSWTTTATDRWSNGGSSQAWGTTLPPNNAIFGIGNDAAAPVTVDGAINVGNMTFNAALTGNYDIAPGSGTLSLASPTNSTITTNAAATISANLGGSGPLIKAGTAALTLSGTISFPARDIGTNATSGSLRAPR